MTYHIRRPKKRDNFRSTREEFDEKRRLAVISMNARARTSSRKRGVKITLAQRVERTPQGE